jgi:hypothetical protein
MNKEYKIIHGEGINWRLLSRYLCKADKITNFQLAILLVFKSINIRTISRGQYSHSLILVTNDSKKVKILTELSNTYLVTRIPTLTLGARR